MYQGGAAEAIALLAKEWAGEVLFGIVAFGVISVSEWRPVGLPEEENDQFDIVAVREHYQQGGVVGVRGQVQLVLER